MRLYVLAIVLFMLTAVSFAEESPVIALEKAPINLHDRASIKRGGKFFATTCMVCHTMIYLRYNKLAQNVGVVYDKMPINVTKWPFDIKPPDLSLEVSRRGADWVYTYLHSFYIDPARPTRANNLLFPNTAMPFILVGLQGAQVKVPEAQLGQSLYHYPRWYDVLEQTSGGTLTPAQFDSLVLDVVNFLAYASTPYHAQQQALGKWVLGFLLIFFILVYLLKKTYWKDLKRSRHAKS